MNPIVDQADADRPLGFFLDPEPLAAHAEDGFRVDHGPDLDGIPGIDGGRPPDFLDLGGDGFDLLLQRLGLLLHFVEFGLGVRRKLCDPAQYDFDAAFELDELGVELGDRFLLVLDQKCQAEVFAGDKDGRHGRGTAGLANHAAAQRDGLAANEPAFWHEERAARLYVGVDDFSLDGDVIAGLDVGVEDIAGVD